MANELRTEVEQVKKQEDVKRALKQASPVQPKDEPKAETKDKLVLTSHAIVLILLIATHYSLQFSPFGFAQRYPNVFGLTQRLVLMKGRSWSHERGLLTCSAATRTP